MARKLSKAQMVEYCFRRLAQDIHPTDREVIERKLEMLGVHCRSCGRAIDNPESVKAWKQDGYGPECRTKVAA